MRIFGYLYWRTGLWRLHARASRIVGRVTCWWTGEHEEIWTVGSMVPIAYCGKPGEEPKPLPKTMEWSGTYCFRCGKTLSGQPHGEVLR